MYTLVIYDITRDDIRELVAKACKEAGLSRIQKSAFLGVINSQKRKELKRRMRKILGKHKGNIQIFLINNEDMKFREIIGKITPEDDEDIMIL